VFAPRWQFAVSRQQRARIIRAATIEKMAASLVIEPGYLALLAQVGDALDAGISGERTR
jgi:hypothetical protein